MDKTPSEAVAVPAPRSALLFETQHTWFVFLSSIDVLFTMIVLALGGVEVNGIAAAVIDHHGLTGMVFFKFLLVMFIVIIVENIGRRRYSTGLRVAEWEVALTSIPVVVSFAQLLAVFAGATH